MNTDYKIVGRQIKILRKRKRISQSELAELVNLAPTYISGIETGKKRPSLEALIALANALETTTDRLLLGNLKYGSCRNCERENSCHFKLILSDCNGFEESLIIDFALKLKESMGKYKEHLKR